MEPVSLEEILAWTDGRRRQGSLKKPIRRFNIDTRRIEPGDFFIPIAGASFDGHDFIPAAAAAGAAGSLCASGRRPAEPLPENFLLVEVPGNTRRALLDLARHYRLRFDIPLLALTGSSGKTTTKELLTHLLAGRFRVLANRGNFNNEIGLPLSLFQLERKHQAAVLELGMNHPGEIALLARTSRPGFGLITNIGTAHLGLMGSRRAIAAAKAELLEALAGGTALLPADDAFYPFLAAFPVRRQVSFGLKPAADYRVKRLKTGPDGTAFILERPDGLPLALTVPLFGAFNLRNTAAACAAALEMGLPAGALAGRLAAFQPVAHRFSVQKWRGAFLVDDTYNANPTSFRAALAEFRRLAGPAPMIVAAGSMGELGRFSRASHLALGRRLAGLEPKLVILLGPERKTMAEGARAAGLPAGRLRPAASNPAAAEILKKNLKPGDWALLKGSRLNRLEELLEALETT